MQKARYILKDFGFWKRLGHAGLFAVTGASIAAIFIAFTTSEPLFKIAQYQQTADIKFENGRLNILVEATGFKNCEMNTSRWLWTRVDDGVNGNLPIYVPLQGGVNSLLQAGEHMKFILSLPVPQNLQDGTWYYFAKTTARCNWIGFPTYVLEFQTPTVPVLIKNGATVEAADHDR